MPYFGYYNYSVGTLVANAVTPEYQFDISFTTTMANRNENQR